MPCAEMALRFQEVASREAEVILSYHEMESGEHAMTLREDEIQTRRTR